MARTNNLTNFLTDVASAIKTKTGDSTAIPASQFDTKIANITTGHLDNTEYTEANIDLDNILQGSTPMTIYPPDWSQIGYEDTPQTIIDGFNYAKEIYDNWDSSITDMQGKYSGNLQLKYFPNVNTSNVITLNSCFVNCNYLENIVLINTSNVTNMYRTFMNCYRLEIIPLLDTFKVENFNEIFKNCSKLKNIPEFDTSNIKFMSNAFGNCSNLTNESLNNILAMCINATNYTGTKTLKYIGLTQAQATTCQTLSNYQAFLDAGWTTGY